MPMLFVLVWVVSVWFAITVTVAYNDISEIVVDVPDTTDSLLGEFTHTYFIQRQAIELFIFSKYMCSAVVLDYS